MNEKEKMRVLYLEGWLQWCLDECDDTPEYNYGFEATKNMRELLAGKDIPPPNMLGKEGED